jgi:hypothetical protein
MKPMRDAWFFQIDITNRCGTKCINCSRHVRHLRPDQLFSMAPYEVHHALDSLKDWPKQIGIIGGEPTVSQFFEDICHVLKSFGPKERYGLWTAGGWKFDQYRTLIEDTFGVIYINPHTSDQQAVCKHQPSLISNLEAVEDETYRKLLVDECWVQMTWCPTITSKGGFFCEVAAAWDHLLDGPGGYRLTHRWWDRDPEGFKDQVDRYCKFCGMPIPLPRQTLNGGKEWVTPHNLKLFQKLKLRNIGPEHLEVFEGVLSVKKLEEFRKNWTPGNYREDVPGGPGSDAIFT